jgi:pyridoxine 5-phosphate synthase
MLAAISAPLNLEMAATEEMVAIAARLRPHAVCLVPERREEVTTEGGLDVAGQHAALAPVVAALAKAGCRVSLFIDPDPAQLRAAASVGAPVVELHTGSYAEGRPGELDRLRAAAELTAELGLECHAGHGLTYANTPPVAALPQVRELNIGHFLIGEAIVDGMAAVITRMREVMDAARS